MPNVGDYIEPTREAVSNFTGELVAGKRYKVLSVKPTAGCIGHFYMKLKGVRGEWDTSWFRKAKKK